MNSSDNGILDSVRAMPLKDLTSNNENFFSMKRMQYAKTASLPVSNTTYLTKKYYGSVSRDSSQRTRQMSRNSVGSGLNYNKQPLSYANIQTNNLVQDQALRRVRNKGYVIPMKSRQTSNVVVNTKPTTNVMNLFYNPTDIYANNVEEMDLLGTVYYKLTGEIYGDEYLNAITYIPIIGENSPYCGCGPEFTTDSTYTTVYSNKLIWFDAIRTPSVTNAWKDIPASYYETVDYRSQEGDFFAKSIYFDEGITSTTETLQEDFFVDYANGIYSGAKVVRFLYDNDNFTREVQIYGY